MKRVVQGIKQAFSKTGIYLSVFSAIVTIIGIIGYDKIFDNSDRLFPRIAFVIVIFVVAYSIAFFKCFCSNSVSVALGDDRTVSVEYGSIFSKTGVIVIPFNCYFDTLVNGDVINENSVVAQFIKKHFSGNLPVLDDTITSELKKTKIIPVTNEEKQNQGKVDAYPIGTIVKVQKGESTFFCVAQTDVVKVDSGKFKSYCNIEMLHATMLDLLKCINDEANGRDVYMPLLGAGFSRFGKPKQVILEYLISILKMSDVPIKSKLHIVLLEEFREYLDLTKAL